MRRVVFHIHRIENYYASGDEEIRLHKDLAHRLEYLTTLHALSRHLSPGCTVLDACAGTGVYAFPLAEAGYHVTAGDLVPFHVQRIRESKQSALLDNIYQGDVLDLSRFPDETFDAVLCLGALYHLMREDERVRALTECMRVLRGGGTLLFSYINRNAVILNKFRTDAGRGELTDIIAHIRETGENGIFYTMDFGEPDNLAASCGIEKTAELATDGLMYPLKEAINAFTPGEFDLYLGYHLSVCEEPSLHGHSMHGLYIGRKREKEKKS